MNILWFSNKAISTGDEGGTGTWLIALANVLKNQENIHLAIITEGKVEFTFYEKSNKIEQWILPLNAYGLPSNTVKNDILKIIDEFKPDLIHVWGVERYWGIVTRELTSKFPILVEIQGLKNEIWKYYDGELSFLEKIKTIGIKEIITRKTVFHQIHNYKSWGRKEERIIKDHQFFSTHSLWAEAKVFAINRNCKMFKNERVLRSEFYNSSSWDYNGDPVIFTSVGYPSPFKGLHVIIKAIELLKNDFANIKLKIAGSIQQKGLRKDGYLNFLINEIKQKRLEDNVEWLGQLDGKRIIEHLKTSSLALFPSYIESYGLAVAESMAFGIPVIASFNGGYSFLGKDEESILFFPPGDFSMCALQVKRILLNKDLAVKLGRNSKNEILIRNNPNKIINQQIKIYKEIIGQWH
jgi:glycosyltransferase involved in cell wall biosynthesis